MARRSEVRRTAARTRYFFQVVVLVACLVGLTTPGVAAPPGMPVASSKVFEKLVLDRIGAFGRGDARAYTRLIGKDFVHISDTGERRTASQMTKYVSAHGAPGNSYSVRDLVWQIRGDLAVVDCEVVLNEDGGQNRQRETDLFTVQNGRWVYLLHQETAILERPAAVAIDPAALADYVGRYRQETGGLDIFSTRAGQLFGQGSPSDEPIPFVPIAPSAFVIAGDPGVMIFERDPQGKVFGYLLHAGNGRTLKAMKIK